MTKQTQSRFFTGAAGDGPLEEFEDLTSLDDLDALEELEEEDTFDAHASYETVSAVPKSTLDSDANAFFARVPVLAQEVNTLPIALSETTEPCVLLIGANELAQEVMPLAQHVGFDVDIFDTDDTWAQRARFAEARYVFCEDYHVLGGEYALGSMHFVVILAQSVETALLAIKPVLASAARYIGVAGDADMQEELVARLRQDGIPQTELACVCCPVGVDIGAKTVEEQAVAIVAELIAARAGRLLAPRLTYKAKK